MFSKTTVLKKISEYDKKGFWKYLGANLSWQKKKEREKEFKAQFKKDPDVIGAIFHKYGMYMAMEYGTRGNPFFNNLEVVNKLLGCNEGIRYVPASLRKNEEVMKKYMGRCMYHGFNPEGIIFYVKPNCPHLLETAKWKKYLKDYANKKTSSFHF